jgi:preprotein translocase subunit YajC
MIFNICLVVGLLIILVLIINEEAKQKKRHAKYYRDMKSQKKHLL